MVKEIKVSILDVEYLVFIGSREELPFIKSEYNGSCYVYDKQIYIILEKGELRTSEGEEEVLREIITHEVSHAFLFESGYSCNDNEESLVVWLSRYIRRIDNCVLDILDKLGDLTRV